MDRRERRRIDVRERIKSAAVELFREKGYEATTVEEIAERADIARGTFFNHFHRKDTLLLALGEDVLDLVEESLGPVESWTGSARDQIMNYLLKLGELASKDRELFKTIMVEEMRQFWMRDELDVVHEQFRSTMQQVLARAQDTDELASEVEVSTAVRLLEAVHVVTIIEWIKSRGDEAELRARLAPLLDMVFRGLSAGSSAAREVQA